MATGVNSLYHGDNTHLYHPLYTYNQIDTVIIMLTDLPGSILRVAAFFGGQIACIFTQDGDDDDNKKSESITNIVTYPIIDTHHGTIYVFKDTELGQV